MKQEVLATDISSLRELFQAILESLESVSRFDQDEQLTYLKRKIQFVLNQGYNASLGHKLEEEERGLNDLLEFTILTLAEAEKSYHASFLDRPRETRRKEGLSAFVAEKG